MSTKKHRHFIQSTALLLLSALLSAGCAGQQQGNAETASLAATPEPFYVSDDYMPVASWEVSGVDLHAAHKLAGDTLYYMAGKWDSEAGGYTEASICRKRGNDNAETVASLGGRDERLILYLMDESENLCYLHSVSSGNDVTYFWTKLSGQGEVLSETAIERPSGSREADAFDRLGDSFIGETDRDGRIVVANPNGDLYLFDETYRLSKIGRANWDENSYSVLEYGLVNAGGRGIYAYHIDGSAITLQQLDMSKGVLKDAGEIKTDSQTCYSLELYSGYDRGIYISDDNTLWQYNFSGGKPITILKWTDGNVNLGGYNVDALGLLPEGAIYLMAHQPGAPASLIQIDFQDRTKVPEKKTVTMTLAWGDAQNIAQTVSDFNRQNTEYQIEVTPLENAEDYQTLYMDLSRGEGPDIFAASSVGIPNFTAKGIIEDLTPYFAESSVVRTSDIIPSILDTWTYGGKTVCIFPSFSIKGFLVQKGTTDQGVWTPDDYLRLAEDHPDSILTGDDPTFFHNEVFYNCIYANLPDYADWQTGECHLDDDEFISLIRRVQRLEQPETTQVSVTTSDGKVHTYYEAVIGQDENDFYNGLLLTKGKIIYGLPGYQELLDYCDFAEFAGYPTTGGEPYYDLWYPNAVSINSSSEVKEGAWAFLEFLLSEKHQNSLSNFPVRQDSFEKYLTRTEFNRGMDTVSFTPEELDALRELVKHIHWSTTAMGRDMLPLITEEIEAVWAGDKSPEDAARIMQNRVSLFLSEQQ